MNSYNQERRAELVEHLAELRARAIRSVVYLALGTAASWFFYDRLFHILTRPMAGVLAKLGSRFLLTSFVEPFLIQVQVCTVAGLIVASPFISCEVWAFVSPGLTSDEKRPIRWALPLSIFLFVSGVVLCYLIMPAACTWFASYVPAGAELRPSVQQSILFTVKFMAAFGAAFELPVVLMLLAKVGLINSGMLKSGWRHSIVGVSVIAAILTPSNDAFSMLCMAIPMALLYVASIYLVMLVELDRPIGVMIRERITSIGRRGR